MGHGAGGMNVYICHNKIELDAAIKREQDRTFVMQQAIESKYEVRIGIPNLPYLPTVPHMYLPIYPTYLPT